MNTTIPTQEQMLDVLCRPSMRPHLDTIIQERILRLEAVFDTLVGQRTNDIEDTPSIPRQTYRLLRRITENIHLWGDRKPIDAHEKAQEIQTTLTNDVVPTVMQLLETHSNTPVHVYHEPAVVTHYAYAHLFSNIIYGDMHHEVPMRPMLGHELSHHLVRTTHNIPHEDYSAFLEGHAIGVEEHLLREDAVRHVSTTHAALRFIRLQDLMQMYATILDRTGTPDEMFSTISGQIFGITGRAHDPPYGIGHALFAIAELKHGPGIYAESLREPRVVLA